MIVTFCGHHNWFGDAEERARLRAVICSLIAEGADTFYLGGYGNFDLYAAETVHNLKSEYPHICSILVIPYMDRDFNRYIYDGSLYPPIEKVPLRFAISKRNEWMVEQADVIVSGVKYSRGGAAATLRCAKRRGKRIISVFE